jgi:dienelactone hydrolase
VEAATTSGRRVELALAAIAVLLAVVGVRGLASWDDGLVRESASADGVPVEVFRTEAGPERRPVAVVAHGFAGSKQLMYAFGPALAHEGYVAVLLDFTGHGANPRPLPSQNGVGAASRDALQADLGAVVGWAVGQPWAAPGRLGLVGHSMGAGAVTRYAAAHPPGSGADGAAATVAVSLPSAEDLPADATRPANLLLLVGEREQDRFFDVAREALRLGYPGGVGGITYGSFEDGSARREQVVPGVEHVTIVFSADTLDATGGWLDEALSYGVTDPAEGPPDRMLWAGVLLLATTLGFVPLASLLLGGRRPLAPHRTVSAGVAGGGMAAGAAVAALVMAAAPGLGGLVPIAVGGYLAAFLAVFGLVCLAVASRTSLGGGDADAPAGLGRPRWATAAASLALAAYLVVAFLSVGHATWVDAGFAGGRKTAGLALALCAFAYFLGEELLARRTRRGRRLALVALSRVLVVVGLLAAVLLLGAPGFLTLIIPLVAVLFAWFAVFGSVVAGRTAAPWAPALVQAAITGAAIAATFPYVA